MADHFDNYVDLGYRPERFARIWVHTHPGDSASPSSTDENTLARCFGSSDWAVMFILAQGGEAYARLVLNSGPGGSLLLPVEIDFSRPFRGPEEIDGEQEYLTAVTEDCVYERHEQHPTAARSPMALDDRLADDWMNDPFFYSERLEVGREQF